MTDRELMVAYLLLKVREEDWHGVSDAANDLREMDAKANAPGAVRYEFKMPEFKQELSGAVPSLFGSTGAKWDNREWAEKEINGLSNRVSMGPKSRKGRRKDSGATKGGRVGRTRTRSKVRNGSHAKGRR